jgi:hypothetical protein
MHFSESMIGWPEILRTEGCLHVSGRQSSVFFVQNVALTHFNPKRTDTCDLGGCPYLRD